MTAPLTLAAVLAAGDPDRLYSGLSLLVSAAVDGGPAAGLFTFRALAFVLDADPAARVRDPVATPVLSAAGRDTLATSFVELLETARALDTLALYACSASVATMALDRDTISGRLDGVRSLPRFLQDAGDARLVFV